MIEIGIVLLIVHHDFQIFDSLQFEHLLIVHICVFSLECFFLKATVTLFSWESISGVCLTSNGEYNGFTLMAVNERQQYKKTSFLFSRVKCIQKMCANK